MPLFIVSIIIGLWFSWSLKLIVITIVFIFMPNVIWIHNVDSPTHTNSVIYCSINWWESLMNILTFRIEWVTWSSAPLHQWTLICWGLFKINSPVISCGFIKWMLMNMLHLWHINSSNFILKHCKWFHRIRRYGDTSTTRYTLMWSLVYTNFIAVNFLS